jgi:hemolysin activation/secretion protein
MHGLARRSVFSTTNFVLRAMSRLGVWHTVYGLALAVFAHAASAQAPSPDTPRFDILEFVIEGDTLLGAPALERAVYPFLGPGKTVADAEGARRALQQAYQEAGYLSVSVVLPPQRVDEGRGEVRLQVIQGVVERLKVTGAEHFLPSGIRQGLPSLAPGSVPQFTEVQQELGQLAALAPDRRITPLLAAGSGPGTLEVELKVEDSRPLHGALELNSKQSQNTERGRLEAALSYDNLFQRQHAIAGNWVVSPREPDQANILSLLYSAPLGGSGDRLSLAYTYSDSDTPTPLGGLTVSRGETWRLRWRDRLDAPEGIKHALSWGWTLRDLKDGNVDVAGFGTSSPPLRYPTFGIDYELSLAGSRPGRQARLGASLSFSLPAFSARTIDCFGVPKEQFACKREQGSPRFQVLGLSAELREPLGTDANGWLLALQLQSQYSDTPLPSSEQVVYGGVDSVRGYFEGEQAGDLGAALRAELWSPRWQPMARVQLRGLGFFDTAGLRKLFALPGEASNVQLASTGLGLRVDTDFGLSASLDWAWLLRDTTRLDRFGKAEPLSGRAASRRQRWDLSVRQSF